MAVVSNEELVAQCRAQLEAGQVTSALAGMTEAYEAAAGAARWPAASWTANWIGHVHEHHLGDLDAALGWFVTSARAAGASAVDLPRSRATARFNAGLVEARRGRTTAALGHFAAARSAAESSDDRLLEATCAQHLGAATAELGAWPGGLAVLRRAEALAEGASESGLAAVCRHQADEVADAISEPPGAQFARLARSGLDRCLAAVGSVEPGRVLDAGCGSAAELAVIAERWPGARVVGVDLAETVRSIRVPRRLRGRVEVCAGDLTAGDLSAGALPQAVEAAGGFDVAVCHAVLHDVAEPGAFLRGLARALRPGGQLVGALFTDAYHRDLRTRLFAAGVPLPRPAISHTEVGVVAALAGAGFTGIETWTESVELHSDETASPDHLERLLGRTLETDETARILDAIGRPLRVDLSPLSFSAVAGRAGS